MDSQSEPQDGREDDAAKLLVPSQALVPAPVGGDGTAVSAWFDAAVAAAEPLLDGTLDAEREAADAYRRMATADNTRRAYRAAVRVWCAWCARHDLPPLPAAGADVAAFLAGERGRKLSPETIKLRRAAIRYLHRAAGCPVPTDDVCVSETLAGIQRDAARKGQLPRKKVAATEKILRRLLAPIPGDLRGLRDRALLLVGFAGALRRSELAAIRLEHLEKTDRGIRLTLPHSKGAQDSAVTVPLPGPRPGGLAAGCRPHRRPGISAHLAAAASQAGHAGRHPASPAPHRPERDHAADRRTSRPGPCRRGRLRVARSRRPQPEARRPDHRHGARHPSGQAEAAWPSQEF